MTNQHSSRRDLLALGAGFAASASLASCTSSRTKSAPPAAEQKAALDDLFSDLSDQRGSAKPISADEHSARRARLGTLLAARGVDAFFCEGGATMTYLAGTGWGHSERTFGLLVIADGSHFWICPAFEAEKAKLAIGKEGGPGGAIVTWDEHEYAFKPLASALRERRAAKLAVDPATRFFIADRMGGELGRDNVSNAAPIVVDLRAIKDAHELELLRRASELTQLAIASASRHVKLGMNGARIAAMLDAAHRKLGMTDPWCLALVGAAAAYPHGDNHAVELGENDFLLVDTGATFLGYQSDTTRTWVPAGAPSAEQAKVWNTVRDAQLRAFGSIRPGAICGDIDRAARAVIDAAGYGPGYRTFTHRLGHGIGLEGHEDPYFDSGNSVALAPGMTLSDEPGIYLYGRLGVRLEDIVVVTASGADHFGAWQSAPNSPA
jgi:Xaa-Pro dipeptidase